MSMKQSRTMTVRLSVTTILIGFCFQGTYLFQAIFVRRVKSCRKYTQVYINRTLILPITKHNFLKLNSFLGASSIGSPNSAGHLPTGGGGCRGSCRPSYRHSSPEETCHWRWSTLRHGQQIQVCCCYNGKCNVTAFYRKGLILVILKTKKQYELILLLFYLPDIIFNSTY